MCKGFCQLIYMCLVEPFCHPAQEFCHEHWILASSCLPTEWAILLLVFTLHDLNPTSFCVGAQSKSFDPSLLRTSLKAMHIYSDHCSSFFTSCAGTPARAAVESTGSLSSQSRVSNQPVLYCSMFGLCFKIPAFSCNGHMQFPLGDIAQDKAQIANGILAKLGLRTGDCMANTIANLVYKCVPVRFLCCCKLLDKPFGFQHYILQFEVCLALPATTLTTLETNAPPATTMKINKHPFFCD